MVLAGIAQKARLPTVTFLVEVLLKHLPKDKAAGLAPVLSDGRFTHDFPIIVVTARQLGLPVSTSMQSSIYELMDLILNCQPRHHSPLVGSGCPGRAARAWESS
jgi:hypothetical protein